MPLKCLVSIILDYLPKNLWDYDHQNVISMNNEMFDSFDDFLKASVKWGPVLHFYCESPFVYWGDCCKTTININFADRGAYVPFDKDGIDRITDYIHSKCLRFTHALDIVGASKKRKYF